MSDKRVILIVMDSLGAGEMPDAGDYGDKGADTIGHIVEKCPDISLPALNRLGYGHVEGVSLPGTPERAEGSFGRAAEASPSKDTITGHWEIAGLITETPFRTFTDTGFPDEFIEEFEKRIGIGVLGNYSASGTEIIEELGPEQRRTGKPIVYTSADSVFQIAADTAVIPLERLYEICETAREMLTGDMQTGRVIARPYVYENGKYTRTSDRRDYAVDPPGETILDCISGAGLEVCAVGKIFDIFNGRGMTSHVHTVSNDDGIDRTLEYMDRCGSGLIFTNLVDFDSLYGHRRDPEGYCRAIEAFDRRIPQIIEKMKADDVLIITADHGNDPVHRGWNHTREYVPVLIYGDNIAADRNIGTLDTFADIGASVCEYLGVERQGDGTGLIGRIGKKLI